MFILFWSVAGLNYPVTLSEDITTESTTEFTTTHRKVSFSTTPEVIFDQTTGSTRSTYRSPKYSLVSSTSLNLDQTTHAKTNYSATEELTVYNSTNTS